RAPGGAALPTALRRSATAPHREHDGQGPPARHRIRGVGPRSPARRPADPGRQRPRRRRVVRGPRADRLAPGSPGRGDPGDRNHPGGHPRGARRRGAGSPRPAAKSRGAGAGHPAHGREPHARQGHGAGRPQARGDHLFHRDQAGPHRGPLSSAARHEAAGVNPNYRLLYRLVPYLKPYWHILAIGAALALVVSSSEGLIAWLVKPAMDGIFLKRDLFMLKLLPLALLGAYILKGAGRFGQSYLMASVGERVIARIRRELYTHIQGMPLSFFASLHSA